MLGDGSCVNKFGWKMVGLDVIVIECGKLVIRGGWMLLLFKLLVMY